MKRLFPLAAALLAACLICSCSESDQGSGKSFEQLPAVDSGQLWAFFGAIPASDLTEELKTPEARSAYKDRFEEMLDGVLGDGEGPETIWSKNDNSIYWSDYFSKPSDYDWTEEDNDKPHPYVNFHAFSDVSGQKLFGVLQSGCYDDGEEQKNPDHYYWYEVGSGKVSAANLKMDKPYTAEDLTADPLLLYGSENLYYAIKNGKYSPSYCDRGFQVFIEDVGNSGVMYQWNGNKFVRDNSTGAICLYNYGFGNIMLGEAVPFSVPGYKTVFVETEGLSTNVYYLVKEGENEPTLLLRSDGDMDIVEIEVCSPRYANVYGVRPGMSVSDFLNVVKEYNSNFEEAPYVSYVETEKGYVEIFCGFDEDFVYKVMNEDYLGDEKFKSDAKIARVAVVNAVG